MKKLCIIRLNTISKIILLIVLMTSFSVTAQTFTESNLPIVIITTDNDPNTGLPLEILDDPKILASRKIIKRAGGTRNYLTDQNTNEFLNYSGRIGIEIRGSSTQTLPKKQYSLTTLKADKTSNNNVSIFGMPSENDWVLNGLGFDPFLVRDYLAYYMTRQLGNYATKTEYFDTASWPSTLDGGGTYLDLISATLDSKVASSLVATDDDTISNSSFLASSTCTIYPNPVSNVLSIEASKPISGVKMFNIFGILVHEVKTNSENVNVDVSAYSNGIYFITICNEDGFTNKKIVKK